MIPLLANCETYEIWEGEVLIYSDDMTRQEPLPELPAEVWSREAFDADRAWRATLIACKGER
jgi:hypothetical protein